MSRNDIFHFEGLRTKNKICKHSGFKNGFNFARNSNKAQRRHRFSGEGQWKQIDMCLRKIFLSQYTIISAWMLLKSKEHLTILKNTPFALISYIFY